MTGIERLRRLDRENEELRDMLNQVAWHLGLGDEVHYYSGDNYAACQSRVLDAIDGLTKRESDVETVRADAMEAWRWVRRRGGLATLELHEETFADMMRQRDEYRDLARGYERDARWVREHGGLAQVEIDYAIFEGFSDLADEVARRLGLCIEGLDAQDSRPLLMGALDRRLMPEGCEWDGSVLRIRTAENVDYDGETLFVLIGGRDE